MTEKDVVTEEPKEPLVTDAFEGLKGLGH